MNLNTIREIQRPASPDEISTWQDGNAWLAGGTWLFSEPQFAVDTLIDLEQLDWPALESSADGLTIAATCRIAELYRFAPPPEWTAAALFHQCCNSFLASFKIWNTATIGGNICMSLPAGPMISLTAGLQGVCTLWPRGGPPRQVPVMDFVTGNHMNVLQAGELLRSIHLPSSALTRRSAFRHCSLTKLGRSAALLIGTNGTAGDLLLTITAATHRPVQISFTHAPSAAELRDAIDTQVPTSLWFDDVHGSAAYKRHVTHYFAEQIRTELATGGSA
jgi:CO/xanthine dehydrogenase FAD-binding subunit